MNMPNIEDGALYLNIFVRVKSWAHYFDTDNKRHVSNTQLLKNMQKDKEIVIYLFDALLEEAGDLSLS